MNDKGGQWPLRGQTMSLLTYLKRHISPQSGEIRSGVKIRHIKMGREINDMVLQWSKNIDGPSN